MNPRHLMTIVYVRDMKRAFAFYRDGLGLEPRQIGGGWSSLACGDALVGLHLLETGASETIVPFAGLNLEVDDLDAAIKRAVDAGATLVEIREPQPRVPVRLGVLTDPDGNGFELRRQFA